MASATRKVLIVDDDPWVGKLVEFVARDLGYEPLLARDGAEALDRYAEELPDVVITDVVLPKVDGLEVCRRVKSTGPGAFTPVLVISGIYRSEREALKRFRADGFYQKPLSPEVLQRRMTGLFPPTFVAPANSTLAPAQKGEVSLEFEPLPRALARLFHQKKTGVLTLRVKGASADLYLREGRLTFARSEQWSESIGAILQRQQRLTTDQRAHLEKLVTQKGDPQSAGELAIREGLITPEELLRLVSNQLVHRVLEAFRWREGFHVFEEGPLPSGAKSALDLDTPSLLHWGMRRTPARAEDVNDFLSSRDVPLARNAEADAVLRTLPLSRAEKWLLERADGTATFNELVGEVPPNDNAAVEAVRKAAMVLAALGALVPITRASRPAEAPAEASATPPRPGEAQPASPQIVVRSLHGTVCGILLELWRRQVTGTLTFEAGAGFRTLFLRAGQLVASRIGDPERLETLLVRRGKIRPEVGAQLRMMIAPGRNAGEALVELQAITQQQLQQFVRTELKGVLKEIVRARELPATFSTAPLPEQDLVRHEWDTAQAVIEAVRSQEMPFVRTMLPPSDAYVVREKRADDYLSILPLNLNEKNLLNLVSSPQPWVRLAALDLVASEDQQRACWVLWALGLVRTAPASEVGVGASAPAVAAKAKAKPRAFAVDDFDPLAGIDPASVDGEEDVVLDADVESGPVRDEEILIEISPGFEPAPPPRVPRSRSSLSVSPTPFPVEEPEPPARPAPPKAAALGKPARVSAASSRPDPVAPRGRRPEPASGSTVPRALYDEVIAEKKDIERRLFALMDATDTVPREIFDQVHAEKNELKAQLVSLLDEVIRLKNAGSFVPTASMPAPSSRRNPVDAFGLDSGNLDDGGVIAFKRTRPS